MAGLDPATHGTATADIGVAEGVITGTNPVMTMVAACQDPKGSGELVQQCLRIFQIGSFETLGEPEVDRCENIAGFGAAPLGAAEPGEARGGAQFPELGLLLPGDAQGFEIKFLRGLGMPLPL
jgi:hypothetical protein